MRYENLRSISIRRKSFGCISKICVKLFFTDAFIQRFNAKEKACIEMRFDKENDMQN